MTMSARPSGRRRSSSRVGRFGPRSLAAGLLTVLIVPMVGLQVFAYREVQTHREAATSAEKVRAQVSLLQQSGRLLAPLYVEFTATDGVTQAEVSGIPRAKLTSAIGIDFIGLIETSRVELDRDLDALAKSSSSVMLPSGLTIGTEVAEIRSELTAMRATFDAGSQDSTEVDRVFQRLVDLLEQITARSAAVFEESATTRELADIGAETEQFLSTLAYATEDLRYVTQAGITNGESSLIVKAMVTAGGFQASLERLRALLSPDRQADFDAMVASEPFRRVAEAMPRWVANINRIGAENVDMLTAPDVVESMIDVLVASFDRLEELQSYGVTFLSQEVQHANRIQDDADRSRHNALVVMIVSIGVSLVLLGLVLNSILRPLRRLVRQSRQVGDGDLALAPVKPTGPTDIRVLMRTFNDMVITLRAYDAQVRRLALGETQIDRSLPGPLGDTLRQSVSHLAAVTSKLHASEAAANIQARTDSLTGLANRAAALERLALLSEQARSDNTRCAIVFLDLDDFKNVNDRQGHGEGDRILGEIGARLRQACPDQLVARIGGDEFIVLVESIDADDDIIAFARKLIGIVSAPCAGSSGQLFTISASAGVSIVDGTRSPLECIAQADSAVYLAKETGRGRVELYDERLARDIEDRADMALTMRQGLAADQFSIKLQPIIDIATKEPVGAEALLRWNRPGIGEVGPNEFIPIAERTGVILDLDAWVIEQAVGILHDWQSDPLTAGLRISVNISGLFIVDGSLSPLLARLCDDAGVDPGMIDLEITETHLVADVARASAVVDDLRRQGIKVAIDDFGTGYSSMSYLHQLTVDILKIDGMFVAGMCENPLDLTIVELLLRLGDSLGLKVVAEGVDGEDKLAALLRLGCQMAQGFYIARPMPVADATVWLRQQVTLASLL
jgi:diguanylate cyclase (GGDEF)-like protein